MFVNIVYVNSYDILKQHSAIFVDKTKFLTAFYTPTLSHRCIYLTAPPGFGKTAIASMVDRFSAVEIDSDNLTFKPTFDTEAFKIFNDTKISRSWNVTAVTPEHLANYTVLRLFVNYKPEETNYVETLSIHKVLQKMVADSVDRYENFLNALVEKMHEEETSFLVKLSNGDMSGYDLPFVLRDLIKILYKYVQRSIILLIDDHDFAAYGITHKNSNNQAEVFYKIFNTMIDNAVKLGPKYVRKAMITSTYSLPFYWSGETGRELADFHHYEFLDDHIFTPFIGFTSVEMQRIVRYEEWDIRKERELTRYCGGYLTTTKLKRIFKPQCIENYIHSRLPINLTGEYNIDFRTTYRDLEFIKPYVKECDFEVQLLLLSYNETISYPSYGILGPAGISLRRFKELQVPTNANISSAIAYKLLWNYLKEYGLVSRHENSTNYYRAPNQEVVLAFQEFVFHYHDESRFDLKKIAISLQLLASAHNDLVHDSVKQSIQNLGKLLSICDKSLPGIYKKRTHEVILQAILFASTLRTSWRYYSPREVNYRPLGRCDMYMYDKQDNVASIVNVEYQGKMVILPNICTSLFPHPDMDFLTILSINVKKTGHVEVSHSIREVSSHKKDLL